MNNKNSLTMSYTTSIKCPVCESGSKIEIEVSALLQGVQFSCPTCKSQVGIQEDSIGAARKAVGEFENLKNKFTNSQKPFKS
jgi:endogenous inhibitor of DNA gyrase (YacG/DUF329 family)